MFFVSCFCLFAVFLYLVVFMCQQIYILSIEFLSFFEIFFFFVLVYVLFIPFLFHTFSFFCSFLFHVFLCFFLAWVSNNGWFLQIKITLTWLRRAYKRFKEPAKHALVTIYRLWPSVYADTQRKRQLKLPTGPSGFKPMHSKLFLVETDAFKTPF